VLNHPQEIAGVASLRALDEYNYLRTSGNAETG